MILFLTSLNWLLERLHSNVGSYRQKCTYRPLPVTPLFTFRYFALHDSLRSSGPVKSKPTTVISLPLIAHAAHGVGSSQSATFSASWLCTQSSAAGRGKS